MASHVRVPGMGVNHGGISEITEHFQVDSQGLDSRISSHQICRNWVRQSARLRVAERMYIHINEFSQFMDKMLNMNASSAIDLRRPFSSH
jgi:hypothetical protein